MIDAKPDWDRIDAVLLDMDGTILDLSFDNYFWAELVPQRYALARAMPLEAALAELTPKFHAIAHTLPWYCTDYWSEVTGLNIAALKREVRERIAPLQGSVEFLQAVRDSGRQLWLVTNAHRDSWSVKLEHTGLAPMFDAIISSHDYGACKEDPLFWDRLQAARPFLRERALFADDSLPVLRAARAYGVAEVVAIRRPDATRPARLELEDFASVDGLYSLLPLPVKA